MVRDGLGWFLGRAGYEIKDRSYPLRAPREFFDILQKLGFTPGTVFDVGVGFGTEWLYEGFPDAYFVLVEANPQFEPSMVDICQRYRGEYHIQAAGADAGTATLQVNRNFATSSGLVPLSQAHAAAMERHNVYRDIEEHDVPVRPLDSLLRPELARPFLMKLDIEGYEIEALKGATQLLRETEVVISEISIRPRFENNMLLADFVAFMDSMGFQLFDIIGMTPMSREGPIAYIDGVFVRKDSRLASG
jgi:FkbM family methyltransferase